MYPKPNLSDFRKCHVPACFFDFARAATVLPIENTGFALILIWILKWFWRFDQDIKQNVYKRLHLSATPCTGFLINCYITNFPSHFLDLSHFSFLALLSAVQAGLSNMPEPDPVIFFKSANVSLVWNMASPRPTSLQNVIAFAHESTSFFDTLYSLKSAPKRPVCHFLLLWIHQLSSVPASTTSHWHKFLTIQCCLRPFWATSSRGWGIQEKD